MVAAKWMSWVGVGTLLLAAQLKAADNPEWTTPIAPFRIVGNLYYVGSQDLASYLIVTPQGSILINSNLPVVNRPTGGSINPILRAKRGDSSVHPENPLPESSRERHAAPV